MDGWFVGLDLPVRHARSASCDELISYFVYGGVSIFLRDMPSDSGALVLDIRTSAGGMPSMHGRLRRAFFRFFDRNALDSSIAANPTQLGHRCDRSAFFGRDPAVFRIVD
jgi:hypothetical protein